MGLPIGPVQVQKCPRQRRRIRGGQAQIGQGRRRIPKQRIGHCLAHIRHQPLRISRRQLGDVKAEFLRQCQHNGCRNGAVIVFHLVEIGQGHPKLGRKILLRQPKPLPSFPQLCTSIEFLRRHDFLNFALRKA